MPSAVTTPVGVISRIGSVTRCTCSCLSVESQVPLSNSMRLPAGGYLGIDFSSSSGSSPRYWRTLSIRSWRSCSFASLTERPPFDHAGSRFTAASMPSAVSQNIRKRYHLA